jgi:hypothetical protein
MFRIKVPANSAVVRTGWGGLKIVTGRAASVWCWPWIHKHFIVTFTSKNLQLEIRGSESVLSKDELVVTCQAQVVLNSLRDQASILQQLRSGDSDRKSSSRMDDMLRRKCTAAIKEILLSSEYDELQGGLLLNDEQKLARLSSQIKSQGFVVETLQIDNVQVADDRDLDEGNLAHLNTIRFKAEKEQQRREENRAREMAAASARQEEKTDELIKEQENKTTAVLSARTDKANEIRGELDEEKQQEIDNATDVGDELEMVELKQEMVTDDEKQKVNPSADRPGQPRPRTAVAGKQPIEFPANASPEMRLEMAKNLEAKRKQESNAALENLEEGAEEWENSQLTALNNERDQGVEAERDKVATREQELEAEQEKEQIDLDDKIREAERKKIKAEEDSRNDVEREALHREYNQSLRNVQDPSLNSNEEWLAAKKAEFDLKLAEQGEIEARRLAEKLAQQDRKETEAKEAKKRDKAHVNLRRIRQEDVEKGEKKRAVNDAKREQAVSESAGRQEEIQEKYASRRKQLTQVEDFGVANTGANSAIEKLTDDSLKLADDDLKLADADLKLADADLKLADDDLKLADDDLKLADDDLKLADDDLKLADDDLTLEDFGDTE